MTRQRMSFFFPLLPCLCVYTCIVVYTCCSPRGAHRVFPCHREGITRLWLCPSPLDPCQQQKTTHRHCADPHSSCTAPAGGSHPPTIMKRYMMRRKLQLVKNLLPFFVCPARDDDLLLFPTWIIVRKVQLQDNNDTNVVMMYISCDEIPFRIY